MKCLVSETTDLCFYCSLWKYKRSEVGESQNCAVNTLCVSTCVSPSPFFCHTELGQKWLSSLTSKRTHVVLHNDLQRFPVILMAACQQNWAKIFGGKLKAFLSQDWIPESDSHLFWLLTSCKEPSLGNTVFPGYLIEIFSL